MKDITEKRFGTDVLDKPGLTIVDFWAEWCGPCKALMPVLEEVASQLGERVAFVKFDVDQGQALPARYGVRGIPALLLFKDGQVVDRRTGTQTASQLIAFLEPHLAPAPAGAATVSPALSAFGNDEKRKRECLARLESSIAAGTVRASGNTYWDGQHGSPLGCASGQADAQAAGAALGMPADLVAVVDQIENLTDRSNSPGEFSARWLASIRPGTDTTAWPLELLLQILAGEHATMLAQGDPSLLALRDKIVALARTSFADAAARQRAWGAVNEACISHPAYLPQRRGSLPTLLNQLAWDFNEGNAKPETVISGMSELTFHSVRQRFNWTEEDQAAFDTAARTTFERAQATGDPSKVHMRMQEEHPELTQRYSTLIGTYTEAARELGDSIRRMLQLQAERS